MTIGDKIILGWVIGVLMGAMLFELEYGGKIKSSTKLTPKLEITITKESVDTVTKEQP
jgi:hypothetical protein